MQLSKLRYQIIQQKQYKGLGSIQCIKQKSKNKQFELYSQNDQRFQVNLKLVSPALVKEIQLELINVASVEVVLLNHKKQVIQRMRQVLSANKQSCRLIPNKFQQVSYVNVIMNNNLINLKRLGIKWVLLNGICDQTANNNKSAIKSNTKSKLKMQEQDEYKINHKTKKSKIDTKEDKQFFNSRVRETRNVTSKQKLLDFSTFQNQFDLKPSPIRKQLKLTDDYKFSEKEIRQKSKIQKQKQQEQTQLAIALSKSEQRQYNLEPQFQKMEIQQEHNPYIQIQKEQSIPQALKRYCDQVYAPQPERTYDIVRLTDEYLQNFSDLNPRWLEAQKKAEQQNNVRQEERLSSYIKLKYLNGQEIYIDGFPEWKKDEIEYYAKQLGCKILGDLKNHCFAIVSKQLAQKLRKKHKDWNNVKYLTQNYIYDCSKYKSKLKPSDYYLRF